MRIQENANPIFCSLDTNTAYTLADVLKHKGFFLCVLGARRIQIFKAYSITLKIAFIQTNKKQVLLLSLWDFYCINVFSTLSAE